MSDELRIHLNGDPADEALIAAIERLPIGAAEVDVEAALQRVKARRFEEPRKTLWSTQLLRAAAVVGVLLGGTLVWHSAISPDHSAVVASATTFKTGIGQMDTLSLPDGTSAILGPASSLTLAAEYGKRSRSVELNGVALFDVKHDASRPFSVKAGNANIVDLGTTFVVRSDAAEGVKVAVTAGTVELHGVVLHKGDRGLLDKAGKATAQAGAVTAQDLAWTEGRLVFDDASLDNVATELRRWFGIELKVADAALTTRHITGSFTGDSADQVLNVISLVLGARVERNGNVAVLYPR